MRQICTVVMSIVIALFCLGLTACGPTMSFSGTFVKDMGNRTYTLTLKSDGTFTYVCKFLNSSGYEDDPVSGSNRTRRNGRYKVYDDRNEAVFNYSYVDEASGMTVSGSATGTLDKDGGKVVLILSGAEMKGTFIKK